MPDLAGRIRAAWPFVLAAGSVPLTTLLAGPCGSACGACPAGGGCLLLYPVILVVAFVGLIRRRVSSALP